MLTGRHLTLRADGSHNDNVAFVGPLAYGHGDESSPKNILYYQQGDLKSDKIWDIWRVEGPSLVWNFRGSRHVHAYININVASKS